MWVGGILSICDWFVGNANVFYNCTYMRLRDDAARTSSSSWVHCCLISRGICKSCGGAMVTWTTSLCAASRGTRPVVWVRVLLCFRCVAESVERGGLVWSCFHYCGRSRFDFRALYLLFTFGVRQGSSCHRLNGRLISGILRNRAHCLGLSLGLVVIGRQN